MTFMKTSKIWKLKSDEFQSLVNSCCSLKEVLLKLELVPVAGNYKTLSDRIKKESVDLTLLTELRVANFRKNGRQSKKENGDIFVENSTVCRGNVKNRIIKQNLIPYKCKCGVTNNWNGERLVLILDHINGINNDHRIENLRFLCPNCNSQTSTFSGRNVKIKSPICPKCSAEYSGAGKQCKKCWLGSQPKKLKISSDELRRLIQEKKPFSEIGRMYNVSGNTIKKWCVKFNIINQ